MGYCITKSKMAAVAAILNALQHFESFKSITDETGLPKKIWKILNTPQVTSSRRQKSCKYRLARFLKAS
jgi:hypothetical protein